MKVRRYIGVALGVVTILLVAGWLLRNSIIQRISNPMLAQYELRITDVSLDALVSGNASISYLELQHANGTVIEIDELQLPIGKSADGYKTYTAGRISVRLPDDGDEEPLELARSISQVLGLPAQLPKTAIAISVLEIDRYPTLQNIRWRISDTDQQFSAIAETTSLTLQIGVLRGQSHSVELSFADIAGTIAAQSLSIEIQESDTGVNLDGTSTLDLPAWKPIFDLLNIRTIAVASGTATLRLNTEFLYELDQIPAVFADFVPTSPIELTYVNPAGELTSVTVLSADRFEITASIPDFEWTLRQAKASLVVSYAELENVIVSLIDFSCQSVELTQACQGGVTISMDNAALPFANVSRLELTMVQDADIREDGVEVRVQPNAILQMTGISDPDLEIAQFDALLTSPAILEIGRNGWQIIAQSVDASIDKYSVLDDLTFSAPVFLDDVALSQEQDNLSAKIGVYTSSSQVTWRGQTIRLPGFKGGIARQDAEVALVLETSGLYEEAGIEASHNLDHEAGRMSLVKGALSFGSQKLSRRLPPWQRDWDLVAGTVALDLQAEWQKAQNDWQFKGQTSIQMTELAGAYKDTAFTGLTTSLAAEFDTTTGITLAPSSIKIALVEIGLPVQNMTADYTAHPATLSVDVRNLRMSAFGGTVTADPFSFHTASDRNTLLLRAESMNLAEILSIKEFGAVEVSGSIGAELPVTIEGQNVTVAGGRLTGDPPGGVIRYRPGLVPNQTDTSGLGIATRALSNFEYDSLSAAVDYEADGNLKVQMRLSGRNPDLQEKRPVVLNLGVENNIPQMLRSLQAARAVEEVLERRIKQ